MKYRGFLVSIVPSSNSVRDWWMQINLWNGYGSNLSGALFVLGQFVGHNHPCPKSDGPSITKKFQANSVHIIGSIKLTGSNMGVSENVVYPKKPNGFADHYPYYINGYFIGNLPNIFRQSQISYITLW